MARVAQVDGAQLMVAGRQVDRQAEPALGVERGAGQLPVAIDDLHRAGGGHAVFAAHAHREGSLGAGSAVVRLGGERGLGGHAAPGRERQRGHGQRDSQNCHSLKPRTAAEKTSHVHCSRCEKIAHRTRFAA